MLNSQRVPPKQETVSDCQPKATSGTLRLGLHAGYDTMVVLSQT